jgi:alkylation response protein AidB-like acyl-CoA dehydrogenase
MDAAERTLLAQTVRDALAAAPSVDDIDQALAELGWLDMLEAEPIDALDIVFRALGAANAAATALDDVVVRALGLQPRPDLAVVLPRFGSWDPPGVLDGTRIRGSGPATARVSNATELLVVATNGDELTFVVVGPDSAEVKRVNGIDPTAGLCAVAIDTAASDAVPFDRAHWDAAVADARRAIAYETAGAARAMLDLARAHALDRVQFGRPVARFQAVRHRLAEALVAIEALDATLHAAADAPGPETAALAKIVAGRSARTVGTHCQQVLAGVGFTTEHPFHRYLKRTMLLDGLFGAADDVVVTVGRTLLATKSVPTLVEL